MFLLMRLLALPSASCTGKALRAASSCCALIIKRRLANCMSLVTLTVAAAMFSQYWGRGFGIAPATFVLLIVILLLNACGVRVSMQPLNHRKKASHLHQIYGNLEWVFKWVKILLILIVCVAMIAIKAGGLPLVIQGQ